MWSQCLGEGRSGRQVCLSKGTCTQAFVRVNVCVCWFGGWGGLGLGLGLGGGFVVKKQETSRHKELRGKGEESGGSQHERACPVTHCSRMCSVNASHC